LVEKKNELVYYKLILLKRMYISERVTFRIINISVHLRVMHALKA